MFRRADLGLCAEVHVGGRVDLPAAAKPESEGFALLDRMCEGAPGAPAALHGCLDFVETRTTCHWRAPNTPLYECGFVDGVCENRKAGAAPD